MDSDASPPNDTRPPHPAGAANATPLPSAPETPVGQLLRGLQELNATLRLDDICQHLLAMAIAQSGAASGLFALRHASGLTQVNVVQGAVAIHPTQPFRPESAAELGLPIVLPVGDALQPYGYVALSDGHAAASNSPYLQVLLGIGASVISSALAHQESQQLNEKLNQRLQELRALLDFGRGLTSVLDVDEIVQLLALTLAGRWAIARYAVHTWREGHDDVFRARGFTFAQLEAIASHYPHITEAVLLGQDGSLEWLRQLGVPPGSMLIPLRSNERTIGLVLCGLRLRNQPYSQEDLEFGLTLASRAAGAIDNAWFVDEALRAREIERELALAAGIQQDLFPKKMPIPPGWDVAARNRQARQVGGDYFDGMALRRDGGDKVLYVVSDVAGKGIGSALLMANMQATLRALLDHEPTLESIAREANELLFASTPGNRYATAFLLLLDPATGEADFVNCAHNQPLLLRASDAQEWLDGPGLALGLMKRSTQQQAHVAIAPGDILVIYTDGVSEAVNLADEEFGEQRLLEIVRQLRHLSARTIVDGIFQAIEYHVGDAPQHDDITLMVVKRNPDGALEA
ncbi:MAG: SpoIIE family protein phosphatase [Bryobacterales bacterium]|jgi:sigma-B regulation protein RsbU (phosphoserine phosphatase)|nr:SpoIIE family protein phosphatase [Bryobacterales bacterium]